MTRQEHVEWAKARALDYVDVGDLGGAFASMASDLRKHPDTSSPALDFLLIGEGMMHVLANDEHGMRRFIEGFN